MKWSARAWIEAWILPAVVGGFIFVIWHAVVVLTGTRVFPKPAQVLVGLFELARSGKLLRFALDSTERVCVGIGYGATFFLVFLGCFFPIVVATANGIRTIPPMYLAIGRNFGLPPSRQFAMVLLPAALPQIFIGLRIALGIGWLVVVAAE